VLAYGVEQSDATLIIFAFFLAFASYFLLLYKTQWELRQLILAGVIVRIAIMFSFPSLSDDIYRFVWDGKLVNQGINPYSHLPSDLNIAIGEEALYDKLNSPDYYSIYPLVCQLTFSLSTFLSNGNIYWTAFIIRFILCLADVGVLWLVLRWLKKNNMPRIRAMWLFLNPLMIIETFGSLHFEILMAFFVLLALSYINNAHKSALAMGASVSTKLLPLMFLPLVFFTKLRLQKQTWFVWFAAILCITFLPITLTIHKSGFFDSVNLYFQTFEFNAGLYYVSRWLGYGILGYNGIAFIGPMLALASMSGILYVSYRYRDATMRYWPEAMTIMFLIYLMGATTVHPWYLILPITLGTISRLNTPLIWSGVIYLSYHAYANEVTTELPWILLIEYSVLTIAIVSDFNKIKRAR
jgi:hypothetical protein